MLDELVKERLKKLSRIKEAKVNPYPAKVKRTLAIGEARKRFGRLSFLRKKIFVVGRIAGLRDQGGVIFADLKDESGTIQLVFKKNELKDLAFFRSAVDIGDFLSAGGVLFKTKKGEESVDVKEWRILAKSLRPLPSSWYGLEETETRLRRRYLDILTNPETKKIFERKNVFWKAAREYLEREDFLEVETPVLELVPGGADARPFKTHHNALDTDFYLRISLELPLKKLLVAGFEKIFEIGRVFRNEGIDTEHLQDYTQLEFYWAYRNYNDLMVFTEKLYKFLIKKTVGSLKTKYRGKEIFWGKKWPKVDYVEAFKKFNKIDPLTVSKSDLLRRAKELGLNPEPYAGKGRLIDLVYKHTVRPKLIQPSFLINPPVEIEPLAKRSEKNPAVVERFQIVACGTELGKGFSELNDPLDQRARFGEQAKLRSAGDKEAQMLDESFLEALEYGMPPAAGFGMSERLFAVLLDRPVRETVIFPLMRPKK